MTTNIFSAAPDNASDANFRIWGKGLADAFAAVGMVKTSDTGQIDWVTVTRPLPSTNVAGYEIWRFNDSLQSTAPLFFKVEYMSGSSGAGAPCVRITAGKGSNGSGTITTIMWPAQIIYASSNSTSPVNWYVSSGDGSMLCVVACPSAGNLYTWMFAMERSRTSAGVASGTGLLTVWQQSNSSSVPAVKTYNYATGIISPVNYASWPAIVPGTGGMAAGGRAAVFPAIAYDGAGNYWQPKCVLSYFSADAAALVPITVPTFGTYLPLGGTPYLGWGNGPNFSGPSPAIAWS